MSVEDRPGYIPIFRKFFDHYLWEEDREYSKAEAWIDCIQMARYKKSEKKKLVAGNLITWGYGQFPASVRFLKKRWSWGSNTKVKNFLEMLESDDMIKVKKEQGQNIVTLCNYSKYDIKNKGEKTGKGQRKDEGKTQSEQNSKKDKKGNKGKNSLFPSDPGSEEPQDFLNKKLNSITDDEIKADKSSTVDEKVNYITWKIHRLLSDTYGDYKNHRKATLGKWRDPIRLLHSEDELSLNEIWKYAKFAHLDDDFWRYTVQSTKGLRNNIDQIRAEFDRKTGASGKLLTHTEMINDMQKRGLETTEGNYEPVDQGEGKKPKWRFING